jgi:hypothetical protein
MSESTKDGGIVSGSVSPVFAPAAMVLGPKQANLFREGSTYLPSAASSDAGWDMLAAMVAPSYLVSARSYMQSNGSYYVTFTIHEAS